MYLKPLVIKPCPGCGSTPDEAIRDFTGRFLVICICGWQSPSRTRSTGAIKAWNKRIVCNNEDILSKRSIEE